MKRAALTILTVFLAFLIPAAVMAQTDYGQPQDQNLQDQEQRTNPDAPSWGPGEGLTITGTVESVNDEAVQIRTTTGMQNIVLADDTRKPVNLKVGDRVTIDYVRNTQGVMIAQQIRPEGTAGTGTTTGTTTETTMHEQHTTGTTTGTGATGLREDTTAMETDTDVEVEVGAEAETGIADVDVTRERETDTMALQNDQDTMDQDTAAYDDTLPATASNLPALALLGLLAFAGAIAIRTGLR